MRYAVGSYLYALDDKGRLSIPRKFKKILGQEFFLVILRKKSCKPLVFFYSLSSYQKLIDGLSDDLPYFLLSFKVKMDSQGRVLIPIELRNFLLFKPNSKRKLSVDIGNLDSVRLQ